MKALLICPAGRPAVAALAETVPLAGIPILGKTLVEYWLEHLATLGVQEVQVLAVDRPQQVRALVGDGALWGLKISVQVEHRELTSDEARLRYCDCEEEWLPSPHDAVVMDHLPGLPELPLFTNHAAWFAAVQAWIPRAATPDRIGLRELAPGVWAGLHVRIAPDAELRGPCWIGDNVHVDAGAVIGPQVVIEPDAFIGQRAEISESIVGPETFVGEFTEVRHSIAWGSTLINWERDSCLKVPDDFLLCSLEPHPPGPAPAGAMARLSTALAAIGSRWRLREYVKKFLESPPVESRRPR